jgi:hypothetical protein
MRVILIQIGSPDIVDGAEDDSNPVDNEEDKLDRKGIAGSADAEYNACITSVTEGVAEGGTGRTDGENDEPGQDHEDYMRRHHARVFGQP